MTQRPCRKSSSRNRADHAIRWISEWCTTPSGEPVRLTEEDRAIIQAYYGELPEPIGGRVGSFLALYHLCGPPARENTAPPPVTTDVFSLWAAASPELRTHLRRVGEVVSCPALGRRWSTAA